MEQELIQAYLRTSYWVDAPSGMTLIRIGQSCPQIDELLEAVAAHTWAFITAWNPLSRELSMAENAVRHTALEDRLASLGLATLPGFGESPDGEWPAERSVFVFGADRDTAEALGQEFEQNAIVFGVLGEPAELILCGKGGEQ
jgi:hypothetical protein